MPPWAPSRARAPLGRRVAHGLRRLTPFGVWVLTIGLVLWLKTMMPATGPMPAMVEVAHGHVSNPVAGLVAKVLVSLHDAVEAEQIVARIDDQRIRLRLAQATLELERLRADLQREEADLRYQVREAEAAQSLDTGIEQRRLVSAVEAAQLAALSTRAQLEEAKVRAEGATIEAERAAELSRQGLIAEPELVRTRTERDALKKRIGELEGLHKEHLSRVETTNQRLREFAPAHPDALPVETALAPMRWRLKAQENILEQIATDQEQLVLRAPIRGRIARISATPGEWLAADRVLIDIVDATPRRLIAYANEAMRLQLAPERRVQVARLDRTVLGTTTVRSVSPTVVRVPERLWRDPRQEEWAYEVIVALTGQEQAGELLRLSPLR